MNYAVIFAGGTGSRMNSKGKPKQFLEVNGKPIIIHTIEIFEKQDEIEAIVVVCIQEWIEHLKKILKRYEIQKVLKIVPGGETGQESIFHGLEAAEELAIEKEDAEAIVLIHDGVRPMIDEQLISDNIACVKAHGSAITTSVVKETIIEVNDDDDVLEVQERKGCRVAKAPQSFYLNEILAEHRKARAEGRNDFIDSCTLMRHYGKKMHSVNGPYENIKITTPDDFYMFRSLLQARENSQIYGL